MNKDFLTGFAVGAQISDPIELSRAYWAWLKSTDMNPVEAIDFEGGGYETGLEVGKLFREETSITCPRCGLTSYNPNDVRERYCGHCHQTIN